MIDTETSLPANEAAEHETIVRAYFSDAAVYWRRIYEDERLLPLIYRERRAATLEWVRQIAQVDSPRALEVGCGAGLTSVALARQGYFVEAVDSTSEMIVLTREEVRRAGVAGRLRASLGDVYQLEFPDTVFDLVVALGVIPWLHSEMQGLREMSRVLKPGGYLIVTADNAARLNRLLDPASTPLLAPARFIAKSAIRLGARPPRFKVKKHYPWEVDRLVFASGLQKVANRTIGFGPFTCFGVQILTDRAGVRVHSALQRLSARNTPFLSLTGSHYMVLARKPQ